MNPLFKTLGFAPAECGEIVCSAKNMKCRWFIAVASLSWLLGLVGCVPFNVPRSPSAKGFVIDAESRAPIVGAQVYFRAEGSGFAVLTDADGYFVIFPKTERRWLPPLPFDFAPVPGIMVVEACGYAPLVFDQKSGRWPQWSNAGQGGNIWVLRREEQLVPAAHTVVFPAPHAKELLDLCSRQPSNVTGVWTPGATDLAGAESKLEAYLKQRPERRDAAMPKWSEYYRQIAGIEISGQRCLFIAYSWSPELASERFREEHKRDVEAEGRTYDPVWWQKYAIAVSDGGAMFFRVVYDPRRQAFIWYEQNGSA